MSLDVSLRYVASTLAIFRHMFAIIVFLVPCVSNSHAGMPTEPELTSSASNDHYPGRKSLASIFLAQAPASTQVRFAADRVAKRSIPTMEVLERKKEKTPRDLERELRKAYSKRLVKNKKLRVMIAGGGIGGLCTALALLKDGHDVHVFEKTAVFRPFGGPIQIATNALEAIRRIDSDVHQEILKKSTTIGDRINGLKDGISDEWFATFDLLKPAQQVQGEPSVVIDRPILQEIFLKKVGRHVTKGQEVVGYEQLPDDAGVIGLLANGKTYHADILIGSDGIHSKVAQQFYDKPKDAEWTGYTCFAGIAKCVPDDVKDVGYKVFLGQKKYFVSVDVGHGRIQWYAFLNIPPRSTNLTGTSKREWLRQTQFEGWTDAVHELIQCTSEDAIEQRDLFDRRPELKWTEGNVALLGDAAHPMMPNLGQGGGMAIEDALVLGQEIRIKEKSPGLYLRRTPTAYAPYALKEFGEKRALRAAAVQGMSRMSSTFLFQYNHPTTVESVMPPKVKNLGVRSAITRSMQGFLQHIAFPLQFEFLFGFPGNAVDPSVFSDYDTQPGQGVEGDLIAMFEGKVRPQDFWETYFG
uniref:Chloroplast zeaxanthin epoxidase n=1 Tax=Karlodinium veneficum TaxID=407301 RepID=A0A1W5VME5_KARVE|nr:chloroplast zeaxanthin epoxidase [Karlodinium veneficum]